MKYLGVKIPKLNGRPQLWSRADGLHHGLRIIYPNGAVQYANYWHDDFYNGCNTRDTQLAAIKASIKYSRNEISWGPTRFLGYL